MIDMLNEELPAYYVHIALNSHEWSTMTIGLHDLRYCPLCKKLEHCGRFMHEPEWHPISPDFFLTPYENRISNWINDLNREKGNG